MNVEPDDKELAERFIASYRESMGLPVLSEPPTSLRDALGDGVRLYRYRGPGKQFAITKDPKVRDALLAAGAVSALQFKMDSQASYPSWDIGLPPFLWELMADGET